MQYFKGTYNQCLDLAARMDEFFGYPSEDMKTTTTSEVERIPNSSECCICVPEDFIPHMTSKESEMFIGDRPSEFFIAD